MYLIRESTIMNKPKKVKKFRDKIRMEVILQTVNEFNRNSRRYPKDVLQESIEKVMPRIKEGGFLGELDHPIDSNPARQVTVWYKDASHKFNEIGWDGNNLTSVIETLAATKHGQYLRDLVVLDKIPVGFSYRGMGDLKPITESGGRTKYEVKPPLHTITWDSVSHPSHETAKLIRVTESECQEILDEAVNCLTENSTSLFFEKDGMICTSEGFCYLPNDFDQLVEQRVVSITERFKF